jgi:hypothetical protein
MPRNEQEARVKEHLAYDIELCQSGHPIVTEALQSVNAATTVQVRNGKLSVTDGPFAETKSQLGGFYLIEERDLSNAIRVAAKMPCASLDGVEVRAIMELDRASGCEQYR